MCTFVKLFRHCPVTCKKDHMAILWHWHGDVNVLPFSVSTQQAGISAQRSVTLEYLLPQAGSMAIVNVQIDD